MVPHLEIFHTLKVKGTIHNFRCCTKRKTCQNTLHLSAFLFGNQLTVPLPISPLCSTSVSLSAMSIYRWIFATFTT
ncbi:unnamed protein product [Mesocestoides corti]|uniref:Ovule protein n=1 Tax=Mesocestoides corti TaxID=53468 RepID=A0A0R3UDL6_MESCO|nr:unnamed protein product [Mesocestoides corti]